MCLENTRHLAATRLRFDMESILLFKMSPPAKSAAPRAGPLVNNRSSVNGLAKFRFCSRRKPCWFSAFLFDYFVLDETLTFCRPTYSLTIRSSNQALTVG